MRHRRQPAQTLVIAVVSMIALLGAVSLVIDAGMYFVLKRQMQNAADAAALAAVWYDQACNGDNWSDYGCQEDLDHAAPDCPAAPNPNTKPCTAAVDTVHANYAALLNLCNGPNLQYRSEPVTISAYPGTPPAGSSVTPYVVSLSCNAPHWFGHILPGVDLTMPINASASAALGWLGPNGQLLGDPTPPPGITPRLVARLIL